MAEEGQPQMEQGKPPSASEPPEKQESLQSNTPPAPTAVDKSTTTDKDKLVGSEAGVIPPATQQTIKGTGQKTKNTKTRSFEKLARRKGNSRTKVREASSSSSSSEDTEDDSDTQPTNKHNRNKRAKKEARRKVAKRRSKAESSSSDSDSEDTSQPEARRRKIEGRRRRKAKSKRSRAKAQTNSSSESNDDESTREKREAPAEKTTGRRSEPAAQVANQVGLQSLLLAQLAGLQLQTPQQATDADRDAPKATESEQVHEEKESRRKKKKSRKVEKGSMVEYVRLDHTYSRKTHQWVTQLSTEDPDVGEYDGYAFNILREFDYQERHTDTRLRIRSPYLMTALKQVMGKVPGITLDDINPNLAFLFLDELKAYRKDAKKMLKKLSKIKRKTKKEKKAVKETKLIEKHVKLLTTYLDEDYEEIKNDLGPLLASGKITFELAWALFKANEVLFTHTYANDEEPRAVKMVVSHKNKSIMEGDYYLVETQYLDHDGKKFGMAEMDIKIGSFKGARPITSLPVYPLKYHPSAEGLSKQLMVRGKKFVELAGMHYKKHTGMAYMKKDRKILRVHVDGRVMLDPATFRRLCPNYAFASIKPQDPDILPDSPYCSSSEDSEEESSEPELEMVDETRPMTGKQAKAYNDWLRKHYKKKICEETDSDNPERKRRVVEDVYVSSGEEDAMEPIDKSNETDEPEFKDDDYLIANPVVLGFSFGQKMWLEFSVDAIGDIEWNEGAFESLIISDEKKSIIKALVQSHDLEAQGSIDDIIRGKGKGLVAVLHGPPGTGKTLTAEGLADMLKKPLYSVSAGDLGTSPARLEQNLSQILDVAHTWRALLLLDEADVFLEARTNYDVGRNALVSIFLRMLEYFEGILFLTTNRVAVFDDAFASRVHIGLKYGGLELKARKKVWGVFLDRVRKLGQGVQMDEFDDSDMSRLASFELNGREIKNAVRTAQSAALINKEVLGMKQLLSVLMVGSVFAKDLKGQGYEEALKFYM